MPRRIRVYTDFAGMECSLAAFKELGLDFDHIGSCDNAPGPVTFIANNFTPASFCSDATTRDNSSVEQPVHAYFAGFPCPPFSTAGKHLGESDPKSGNMISYVVKFIFEVLPWTFLLENVAGMQRCHRDFVQKIKDIIAQHGQYNLYVSTCNAAECTVLPQMRDRIWFVGILKTIDVGSFRFPGPMDDGPTPINFVLDPPDDSLHQVCSRCPPSSQATALRNFSASLRKLLDDGCSPFAEDYVLDLDGSGPHCKKDLSFCLTAARMASGGWWITSRGRRLRLDEMCRLQGYDPAYVTTLKGVTPRQFAVMCGNGMAVPVVARILYRLLPAAKLVGTRNMHAVWESVQSGRRRLLQMRAHKLPVATLKARGGVLIKRPPSVVGS